jgi:hypothetical protein
MKRFATSFLLLGSALFAAEPASPQPVMAAVNEKAGL